MDALSIVASGLIGALVGAGATLLPQYRASRELPADEVRKRKVEIVYRLLGARYVLGNFSTGQATRFGF
jgi:hypothetical protein